MFLSFSLLFFLDFLPSFPILVLSVEQRLHLEPSFASCALMFGHTAALRTALAV